MDVVLIAGSLALSPYLPKHLASSQVSSSHSQSSPRQIQRQPSTRYVVPLSVKLSTGLSFLLLTLSVLESIPSSWMLLLDSASLPLAYRALFMIVVCFDFIIFPFAAGAQQQQVVLKSVCCRGEKSSKKQSTQSTRGNSRLHSCLVAMFICMFRCILRAIYFVTYLPARKLWLRKRERKGPILAMTNNDTNNSPTGSKTADVAAHDSSMSRRLRILPQTMIGGMFGILLVFAVLRVLGPWVVRTTETTPLLTVALSWLTATGLLLSACINGFGSVAMPHSCLAGFYLEPIRPEAITKAQEEVQKAKDSVQERKDQMESSSLSVQSGMPTSSLKPLQSFSDIGEEVSLRRKNLAQEIGFLETLVAEMEDEVREMMEMKIVADSARTPMGRFKLWLGVIFSIVLLVRLFSAVMFLWKHDHGSLSSHEPRRGSDPITMILLWLLGHDYVTQQDYNTLSQLISVILTAVLSFSQIRTFWRTVDALNRKLHNMCRNVPCVSGCHKSQTQDKLSPSSSSLVYDNFLACMMGCYFLSCIVLTKLMLPPDHRTAFSHALGHPQSETEDGDGGSNEMFRIRSYAVNLTFTLSALLTTFILTILLGIQRQNTVRHLSVWKTARSDSTFEP